VNELVSKIFSQFCSLGSHQAAVLDFTAALLNNTQGTDGLHDSPLEEGGMSACASEQGIFSGLTGN
jgi:hypothetical protein